MLLQKLALGKKFMQQHEVKKKSKKLKYKFFKDAK